MDHPDLPSLVADYRATLNAWRHAHGRASADLTTRLGVLEDELGAHPAVVRAAAGSGTARPPRDWAPVRLGAIAVVLVVLGALAFGERLRAADAETQLDICHRICTAPTQPQETPK